VYIYTILFVLNAIVSMVAFAHGIGIHASRLRFTGLGV